MIEAKIICDSISPNGTRLTSFQLKYPRYILAEFNTHRIFSRSSSSSRAIPIKKMLSDVYKDPVYPVFWGKNKPGMQAKEELSGISLSLVKKLWRVASFFAIAFAYLFYKLGLHKQIGNRILEPWMWANTIVTATDWDNFFLLRNHNDAQPEFHVLAGMMQELYEENTPTFINYGEWHLPYIKDTDKSNYQIDDLIKMSVARCARVSYNNHSGKKSSFEEDVSLHDKLLKSFPPHASPSEHQATPIRSKEYSKNFYGWEQYRLEVEYYWEKSEDTFGFN
jgi:thymidylate synthase ThyX